MLSPTIKLILFCLLLSFVSTYVEAQSQITQVSRSGDLILNQQGWNLPDLTKLKVEWRRKAKWIKNVNRKIYVSSYDTDFIKVFVNNEDGTPNAKDEIYIYNLMVYEADGRKFCYRMQYSEVTKPGEAGIAVLFNYVFYDLDGDGKFETWDQSETFMDSPKIPDWIKK